MEIIYLMKQCLFDGFLKEREERELERKLMQVVEGFPAIRITDNHVNQKAVCVICLKILKVQKSHAICLATKGTCFTGIAFRIGAKRKINAASFDCNLENS